MTRTSSSCADDLNNGNMSRFDNHSCHASANDSGILPQRICWNMRISDFHEPAKSEEQDQSTVSESQTHRINITSQRRGIAIDELQISSANKEERISCARCPNNSAPHLNANF